VAGKDGAIEAVDPWGTRVRCHAPAPEFGKTELGLVYIDFDVPPGTAGGISRFTTKGEGARRPPKGARCRGRPLPTLMFTETSAAA
jgi:hypothetical protein